MKRKKWFPIKSKKDNPKLTGHFLVTLDWGDTGLNDFGKDECWVAYYDRDKKQWLYADETEMPYGVRVLAYRSKFPKPYKEYKRG